MTLILPTFYGIDVSKDTLDICFQAKESSIKTKIIDNNRISIEHWIKSLATRSRVVFEPTGSYSNKLQRLLEEADIEYSIVTPAKSHAFTQVLGKHNKTDASDAHSLYLMGKTLNLAPYSPKSNDMHERKQLLTALNALTKQRSQLSNQIHALSQNLYLVPTAVHALEGTLEAVEHNIGLIEAKLKTYPDAEELRVRKLMLSVTGIGPKSAELFILITNGFQTFENHKQVAKFVGVAPSSKQSGSSVRTKGRINKNGTAQLRGVLYMAARSAKRHNPACKALYDRMRKKGKPHKSAMVAVINKLISQTFAVVKSGVPFDKEYGKKEKKD